MSNHGANTLNNIVSQFLKKFDDGHADTNKSVSKKLDSNKIIIENTDQNSLLLEQLLESVLNGQHPPPATPKNKKSVARFVNALKQDRSPKPRQPSK